MYPSPESWSHPQPCTLDEGDPCDPCHYSAEIAALAAAPDGVLIADAFAKLFRDRCHLDIFDFLYDFEDFKEAVLQADVMKLVTMWNGKLRAIPDAWKENEADRT